MVGFRKKIMNNQNYFIQTFTKKMVNPLSMSIDEIDIVDIAHSLSLQCRFSGHCSRFYSVAEHSIYVSSLLPQEFKLAGLLHDASEAYLDDIPTPVKNQIQDYKMYEYALMDKIFRKFNISYSYKNQEIKYADLTILYYEKKELMADTKNFDYINWSEKQKNLDLKINTWYPRVAEYRFLNLFNALWKE